MAAQPASPPPVVGPASPCPDTLQSSAQACSDRPLDGKTYAPLQVFPGLSWNSNAYVLKPAEPGRPYDSPLVQGGKGAYTGHTVGVLPEGLHIDDAGHLFGTPLAQPSRQFNFLLVVRDGSGAGRELTLPFEIALGGPDPSGAPRPRPNPGYWPVTRATPVLRSSRAPPVGDAPQPDQVTAPSNPTMLSYLATAKGVAALAAIAAAKPQPVVAPIKLPPTSAGRRVGGAMSPAEPPPRTTPAPSTCTAQAADPASMADVEYPSAGLFIAALKCRFGARWSEAVQAVGLEQAQANWASLGHGAAAWSAVWDLSWGATPGCNCVPVVKDSVVYGFLPFWRGPVPPKIDFSRFHRISVLAATMLDDGGWLRPNLVPAIDGGAERSTEAVWRGVTSRLANQALEHGTQLDLALRAPDVDTLRRLAERKLVDYSARTAVGLADTPLQGGHLGAIPLPEWKRLLWPVWNAPRHAFGGVTLILPPDLLAQSQPDANALAMGYVTAVIRAMQATGRPYVLNIVAPEGLALPAQADGQLPLEQRTFWENFLQMKKFAEPLKAHRGAQGVETPYSGGTDITVRLVIPLPESTKVTKKLLRANVEKPPSITGGDRAEILNSIVPVVFSPTGGETLSPDALHQLDDDMIYFKQNFAGIAIWPPPLKGAPSGDQTYSKLQSNFFGDHDYFCFTAFRLFWQCVAIAVFLYGLAVAILRPLDRRYAYAWWVGAALSVALGILILNFDPGLSEIASGNGLLFFVLAMALIGAGVGFAKPKVTPP